MRLYDTVPIEDVQDGNETDGAGEMAEGEETEKMGMGGYQYKASGVDLASSSPASLNATPFYASALRATFDPRGSTVTHLHPGAGKN